MSLYKSTGFKLRELIKEMIPVSDYKISFGVLKETEEKAIRIRLLGTTSSSEKTGDNEVVNKSDVLTLEVQTGTSENDIDAGVYYCEQIYKTLNKAVNVINNDNTVAIMKIDSYGDINDVGTNKHGIACFSINFYVYYTELE